MKLSRAQFSWILYDMANAAFALIVRTAFAPIFFKNYAATGLDPASATSRWGFVSSGAGIVAAVLAPWLGTIADANSGRKKYLAGFMGVGILATISLVLVPQGSATLALTIYFISLIAYMGSNSFYDSLLINISPQAGFHRLSTLAYAWGYVGGMIPFVICLIIQYFVPAGSFTGVKISFVIAALWWTFISLPLFCNVKENAVPHPPIKASDGFHRLIATAKKIGMYRNVVIFLIAYFLYIDGVGTIYTMAVPISQDIGISTGWLYGTIFGLQILGFPFTMLYGKLAKSINAKKLIYLATGIYILITLIVAVIPSLRGDRERLIAFLFAAFLIGTSQGGIQSLSRSIFGKIIPPEHASEFFGFYNIFGKFTTIVGPVLIGIAVWLFGRSEYGIALLAIPFLAGSLLLSRVYIPGEGSKVVEHD